MQSLRHVLKDRLHIDYQLVRLGLAEFLGTALLIIIGDGSVAQSVLSRKGAGEFISINFGWGFAVLFGVYVCGGVSGGHINPAMSLAFCLMGRLKWAKLPIYMLAQYLGAFFGSAVLFAVYYDALEAFDGGNRSVSGNLGTAGIWATYPQSFMSAGGCYADQILGTAILALCVLAITDKKNLNVPQHLVPLLVGSTVVAIGMSFGFNCGYAINPARDFGPRIFTAMAGWGGAVFRYPFGSYFLIPIIGPHIGAILGTWVYQLCVGLHWPHNDPKTRSRSPNDVEMNSGDEDDDAKQKLNIPRRAHV